MCLFTFSFSFPLHIFFLFQFISFYFISLFILNVIYCFFISSFFCFFVCIFVYFLISWYLSRVWLIHFFTFRLFIITTSCLYSLTFPVDPWSLLHSLFLLFIYSYIWLFVDSFHRHGAIFVIFSYLLFICLFLPLSVCLFYFVYFLICQFISFDSLCVCVLLLFLIFVSFFLGHFIIFRLSSIYSFISLCVDSSSFLFFISFIR